MNLLATMAILSAVPTGALAQGVTARQATPQETGQPESVEVESPMLVEVDIPAWKIGVRDKPSAWTTRETSKFVCDKARVQQMQVRRDPKPLQKAVGPGAYDWPRGATMTLVVMPTLSTEWYRQDVDVTIALYTADAKTPLGSKHWDNLTIGVENAASAIGVWGSSSSKRPMLVVGLTEAQVERFEAQGLRATVTVAIQD